MAYATHSRRQAGRRPAAPARKTGTWKLAYADFLTALMAFFLILWLVSGVSAEDRAAIASEFSYQTRTPADAAMAAPSEAEHLLAMLERSGALNAAGENVLLTASAAGVRVELTDTAGRPLFETGSGALNADGRELLNSLAGLLASLPHPVSVEGHTDAFPAPAVEFSNWELSSSRAHEARRMLAEAGIDGSRFRAVTGYADTRPLSPGQPHLAANRRISLEVHTGR